jgi:hypothetical protein
MTTYTIKDIASKNKDIYIVAIDEEAMTLSIENTKTQAKKAWAMEIDSTYIYKFFKRKVKVFSIKEINKFFKEMENEYLFICRFDHVVKDFNLQ